jgi:dipeptidyl aminopeptidase/acylaminoacyl peptidase
MELSEISEIVKYKYITFNETYPDHIQKLANKHKDIEIISIIYKSDNLLIHGYIFKKKDLENNSPVVIYCRGGNNNKLMKIGEIKPGSVFNKPIYNILQQNIIIFVSNLRGSTKSQGEDEFCGHDINDIINLNPIIKKYKISNENKITLFGWSRGCTSALLVSKKIKWIKSMILIAGNYDYSIDAKFRPKYHKKLIENFKFSQDDLQKRSALNWVNEIPNVPILLLHGNSDIKVSVISSLKLAIKLFIHKIPYKLVVYPEGDHDLHQYIDQVNEEINNHLIANY